MPETTSPVELGVYASFTLLVLREVFRFVKDLLAKRSDELVGLRTEMIREMDQIKNDLSQIASHVDTLFRKIEISVDREQRFWDRDWPALVSTVASNTRRVTAAESGLAQVQTHLNLQLTPPHGVSTEPMR